MKDGNEEEEEEEEEEEKEKEEMASVRNARSRVATKNSTLARSSSLRYTAKHSCSFGGEMHVPIPTM